MSVSVLDFGRHTRRFKALAVALAVFGLATATNLPAAAQDAVPAPVETPAPAVEAAPAVEEAVEDAIPEFDPDAIVATVNGEPITERDLAYVAGIMANQLTQFPQEAWREVLIEVAIQFRLFAAEATEIDLDQTAEFLAEMEINRQRILRQNYIGEIIFPTITEQQIEEAYAALVAGMNLPQEVRIRHIMVASEAEATDIIRRIYAGEDFATLAFELSLDRGTAENGGLIDEFLEPGILVPEFDDVVFNYQTGELVPFPIALQENWHVVMVEDNRRRPPPRLDELRTEIEQQLYTQAYTVALEELRAAAEVVIIGQEATEDAAAPAVEEAAPAPAEEAAPAPAEEAAPAPAADDAAAADAAAPVEVAGDAVAGEAVAAQCVACHTVAEGAPNGFGPNLFGIVGRAVGGLAEFAYSPALAALNADGAVWSPELLDAFLANPQTAVPGTTMPFGGIANETDRTNLVAYLATLTAE